jgi:MFS family permease
VSPILAHKAFLWAIVTNFFFSLSLSGFVFLPLRIKELGGTEVEIGVVMALFSVAGIVCQPLIGPWVDAVGRRPFMLLGLALLVLSGLLASVADRLVLLGVVRALQGLGFSAFFVASFSYVVDLMPPARRGWALGIFGVSGMISTAVAPLFGEWVIRRFGFPPLFLLSAALAVVGASFVWRLRETRPAGTVPGAFESARIRLADVAQRHMAITVFFALGGGAIFAFLPTFARSLGVHTLALFYTAYACAAMAVRIAGGELIDTHGRRAVIVPSMFVQAIATALLAGPVLLLAVAPDAPVLPLLFLAGLLAGGAHGFLYPGLAALVVDRTPEARRGAVVGVFSAVFLVGQAIGAIAFGYVAHALGYLLMWSTLSALLFVGSLLSLGLERDSRIQRAEAVDPPRRGVYWRRSRARREPGSVPQDGSEVGP